MTAQAAGALKGACFILLVIAPLVMTFTITAITFIKQEAQLLLGDRATRKHAKDC